MQPKELSQWQIPISLPGIEIAIIQTEERWAFFRYQPYASLNVFYYSTLIGDIYTHNVVGCIKY